MDSQTLPNEALSDDTGHAEAKMRRNLGLGEPLNGLQPSSSGDPLKSARQAIRSQVTAREYIERQLVEAQSATQDLRTRLRHVHHERETAVSAAQSAMSAKDAAERSVRAAEAALASERASRVRTEVMLRDAEAAIRELREKLAIANQNLRCVQAELIAERHAEQTADDVDRPVVAASTDATAPSGRRPVGPTEGSQFEADPDAGQSIE